jgi:hypothetical protein
MRTFAVLVMVLVGGAASTGAGQSRIPSASALLDNRVRTETSVHADSAVPGGKAVLDVEVRPSEGMRVFAPGAKNFAPPVVVFNLPKGIKPGKPSYDVPEYEKNPGNDKRVPLYTRSFTIRHTVTIDKNVKPGTVIEVLGALTYQTCDQRTVFPTRSSQLRWTIRVDAPANH